MLSLHGALLNGLIYRLLMVACAAVITGLSERRSVLIAGLNIAGNTATLLAVAGAAMTAVIEPSEPTPKRSLN